MAKTVEYSVMGVPIVFSVKGTPMGKQRPRHNRFTNATYTPQKTKDREDEIAAAYQRKYGLYAFPEGIYLELSVVAAMPIPKRTSKANREKMIRQDIMPTAKPDGDNILKLVADALNGIAYCDDRQIVKMTVTKIYSESPETAVVLREYSRCNPTKGSETT